ncbi:MAG: hypothetical protein KJ928_06675 [Candidatus Altiarchaeota archaeon]|nr:hypothetical protein [Candidatus Altiarchaeota archaeon]
MTSESVSYATGTIASCNGKDSAFALGLEVRARAVPCKGKGISFKGCKVSREVNKSVEKAKRFLKVKGGIRIEIDNGIPAKSGLGEDEAIAVAAALSLAAEKGRTMELQLDKFLRTQVFETGDGFVNKKDLVEYIHVPGMSFARLCASLFGGFFVTEGKKILRRGEMENLQAVVLASKGGNLKPATDIAWQEALKGNLYQAMRLNSSLSGSDDVMQKMLGKGALTVATSGNSVIGLVRGKKATKISGKIKTRISNIEARVLQKPRKILRINEFMRLKGEQEFYFL